MCWKYPASILLQGSYYRILNSQYDELSRTIIHESDMNKQSYTLNIVAQHNSVDFVLIQAVSSAQMQELPSRPHKINVSGQ